MDPVRATLERIQLLLTPGARGEETAREIAEVIRRAGGYRWVGLYAVTADPGGHEAEIGAIAWTGAEAPAFPRFPVGQGLCGAAVRSRGAVVVGDVRSDSRYLTTFGSTLSEVVVPVLGGQGVVTGLVDVESDRLNAFDDGDLQLLCRCAVALRPLFSAG